MNFFSLDEKGIPQNTILSKNIIIELFGPYKGSVNVDLRAHHIVCQENIVVSLEWVRDYGILNDSGLMFPFSLFNKGMLIPETSQGEWMRIKGAGIGLALKVIK